MLKSVVVRLSVVLIFLLSASAGFGQEPPGPGPKKARTPEDYTSRTLKEIALKSAGEGSEQDENGAVVFGDILPSRATVTFKGLVRTFPQSKKNLLHRWAQRFAGAPVHYTANYQSEMLFNEAGVDYWLAIRKQSLKSFQADLKRGDSVELFLVRLGSVQAGGQRETLLLVESFQKPR